MVASGEPLSRILDELICFMGAQFGEALCSVLLVDETKTRLQRASAPSLPEAYDRHVDGLRIGAVSGSRGTAIYRKQMGIVSGIEHGPLWAQARSLALSSTLRACTSAPILDSQGEPLGTFAFYYRTARRPSARDLAPIDISRDLAGSATRAVPVHNRGGLGLGLWLSRQFVERMRGHSAVQSELGTGATLHRGITPVS